MKIKVALKYYIYIYINNLHAEEAEEAMEEVLEKRIKKKKKGEEAMLEKGSTCKGFRKWVSLHVPCFSNKNFLTHSTMKLLKGSVSFFFSLSFLWRRRRRRRWVLGIYITKGLQNLWCVVLERGKREKWKKQVSVCWGYGMPYPFSLLLWYCVMQEIEVEVSLLKLHI